MDSIDLIQHVVPPGGWYCAVGINPRIKDDLKQEMTDSLEGLRSIFEKYSAEDRNVYFALAKFKSKDGKRKATNVATLKALWLDIDCGPDKPTQIEPSTGLPKGYATQAEGLVELKKFQDLLDFPDPTIVNSGNGWHIYWAFTEEVSAAAWKPVAARLKEVCVKQKFLADPRVFDVSRVLRPPGTLNLKYDPPSAVVAEEVHPPVEFETLQELLGIEAGVEEVDTHSATPPLLPNNLSENYAKSFDRLMTRSDGCLQLWDCYENRATLAEPRWFNALSIAQHCDDRDTAIQKISRGHPDYSAAAVVRKASSIEWPHSCESFASNNPTGCKNCKHQGVIKNPIVLAMNVEADELLEVELTQAEGGTVPFKVPPYPPGYIRGKPNGGIYKENVGEESGPPKLVYAYDFYILKRMQDPELGLVAVFHLITPQDGLREFVVANNKLTDSMSVRREISTHGVLTNSSGYVLLTEYIIASLIHLQDNVRYETMRVQFGWADNFRKFIVGEREITAEGVYHSPAASVTEELAQYFEPSGSLEKWSEVFNLYNKEGMEVQAFAALTGFGAPLLSFTGQKGALINLIHGDSGAGKTTVLRVANSVCGHPESLLGTPNDTAPAKITKLGLLNSVVNTMDEMTNLSAKAISSFAYAVSQGKGNDKADQKENKLRRNSTSWRTICLTSSNASFYQKLGTLKDNPDGEMMRILEFHVGYVDTDIISLEEAKEMFDHQLDENYGHAIVPFMHYVIPNLEATKKLVRATQNKIDTELRLTGRERNWSAVISANFAAGVIANELGLIDFDMERIYKVVAPLLLDMKHETTAPLGVPSATIGDFIIRHIDNTLVTNGAVDGRFSKPIAPDMLPRGELVIRFEQDTKRMFIPVRKLREDCMDSQTDYKTLIKELTASGVCVGTDGKRLSKGMKITSPSVRCVIFDTSHPDFLDMESITDRGEKDTDNGSGEDNVSDTLEEV